MKKSLVILTALIIVAVIYLVSQEQETPRTIKSLQTMIDPFDFEFCFFELNVGVAQSWPTDSQLYRTSKNAILDSARQCFEDVFVPEVSRDRIDVWISERMPDRFWNEVSKQVTISKVLMIWEIGSLEGVSYSCHALIETEDGFVTAQSSHYSMADSAVVVPLSREQVRVIEDIVRNNLKKDSLLVEYEGLLDGSFRIFAATLDSNNYAAFSYISLGSDSSFANKLNAALAKIK